MLVYMTEASFKVTPAVSKKQGYEEPWIIATNGQPNRAIRDYTYRFGSIEALFKNQKSNGFFIESINNANIKSFTSMYSLVCFCSLFLTIIGADYSKNNSCYKHVKITTHKNYKSKGKIRVMSLFKTGLTLFKKAINSLVYIRIPFNLILYDI